MRIAGNYTFEAPREEVWAALNDPEVLARTIPGCQRLDEVGEHEYESTLKVGLQAVRGVYTGRVKIDNRVPPESYEIHVDGKGSNGFLKGAGSIKLRTDGAHTILDYGGEAQVGGTIASVGQRLLDGAAKTLINQSLKALAAQIAERRLHVAEHTAEVRAAVAEELAHEAAAKPAQPAAPEVARPAAAPAAPTAGAPAPAAPVPQPLNGIAPEIAPAARRSFTVPPGQGLSEQAVARGAVEDFVKENPWVPWVIIAFLLGFLFGRRS
ncbi:MAG TPA: carbon monoxide dehydrogenase subunit G [Chloroflexaceae bacterium]|nr:carbon monoxide dehydrogenase subunit G [Chloroflexaceae bacterium]